MYVGNRLRSNEKGRAVLVLYRNEPGTNSHNLHIRKPQEISLDHHTSHSNPNSIEIHFRIIHQYLS